MKNQQPSTTAAEDRALVESANFSVAIATAFHATYGKGSDMKLEFFVVEDAHHGDPEGTEMALYGMDAVDFKISISQLLETAARRGLVRQSLYAVFEKPALRNDGIVNDWLLPINLLIEWFLGMKEHQLHADSFEVFEFTALNHIDNPRHQLVVEFILGPSRRYPDFEKRAVQVMINRGPTLGAPELSHRYKPSSGWERVNDRLLT